MGMIACLVTMNGGVFGVSTLGRPEYSIENPLGFIFGSTWTKPKPFEALEEHRPSIFKMTSNPCASENPRRV
jgi:hypothetical protein